MTIHLVFFFIEDSNSIIRKSSTLQSNTCEVRCFHCFHSFPTMADDEEFETWKLCHEINIRSHIRCADRDLGSSTSNQCMWCGNMEPLERTLIPDFASVASCLAGHDPKVDFFGWVTKISTCSECEVDLVQHITERKQECFFEGCRRMMLVDKHKVRLKLGDCDLVTK